MIAPATAGATCVRKRSLNPLLVSRGLIELPFVFSRIPPRDFAGTSINPVPIDSGSHVGVAATFGIMDFAENKAEISVRCFFGAVCDAVRQNALFVDAVAFKGALQ